MSAGSQDLSSAGNELAPPFPAAITISGNAWHSQLVPSGPIPLIHPETYIGLLDSNDIVLHDPAASRIHAVVRWTAEGYQVQDLGSRGGTLVNGQAIDGQMTLTPGEQLRIGSTNLLFQSVRVAEPNELGSTPTLITLGGLPTPHISGQAPYDMAVQAAMSVESITNAVHLAQSSSYGRWLSQQIPRYYWRIFVIGLVAYFAASRVLGSTLNTNLIPLVALLGSVLVPVTFVVFCWEQRAFADFPPTVVGLAFVAGATVGLLAAAILEPKFVIGAGFGAALIVALIEETVKASAALWFLGDNRRYRQFDGLVLGAAVGMGFAALETAGYGISFFLYGFVNASQLQNATYNSALSAGVHQMVHVLDVRMLLAFFGHGVWTGILCATIWRERRESHAPRVMSSFVPAYAISVLLGNLWGATPGGAALGRAVDRSLANLRISSSVIAAYVGVVLLHAFWDSTDSYVLYFLYGFIGLFVLHFLIEEALERARLGLDAPPPPPLLFALLAHLIHVFHRIHRPVVEAIAFATAAERSFAASAARFTDGVNAPTPAGATGAMSEPISPNPQSTVPESANRITPAALHANEAQNSQVTTSGTAELATQFCSNCGVAVPPHAHFCLHCGAAVTP